MLRFDVITLFPEMFAGVLGGSILKRAAESLRDPAAPDDASRERGPVASYHLHQLRDFSADEKHRKVDKPPFGGGPGMVMQCQPLWDAVKGVEAQEPGCKAHRVFVTPTGRPLTQRVAEELAGKERLLLICGHYEGFDQRVLDRLGDEGGLDEISVGDVVLSGGELPAMTVMDAVVRLLPGALGDAESAARDSFSPGVGRLLDHPHFTGPREWEGRAVPEVLLSGNHGKIEAWRKAQSRALTEARRPDLLTGGVGVGGGAMPVAVIRESEKGEGDSIFAAQAEAFGREEEARLVKALEKDGRDLISVVAEVGGEVAGHAVVTEVTLGDQLAVRGLLAMGPVGVRPVFQRRGLGSALVGACIREAREAGASRLFVLGEPAFYARFGFEPAGEKGFDSAFGGGSAFQVLVLRPGKVVDGGRIVYAAAFGGAG